MYRREELGIDAVAHGIHPPFAFRCTTEEQFGFVLGHKERMRRPLRHGALERQQSRSLAPIEPGHRPAVIGGILRPFGRIHVNEVDERAQVRNTLDILRHR